MRQAYQPAMGPSRIISPKNGRNAMIYLGPFDEDDEDEDDDDGYYDLIEEPADEADPNVDL
jgi:hypothetical protein